MKKELTVKEASTISTMTSTTVKAPALSKRSETWLSVALAVSGPLVLFGLLEGLTFLWERAQARGPYAWELVASRRIVWEPHPEPGFGYTLMKPGSHYEFQGIPVDINSHGLRGPEIAYEKPPATFRILNLGDSVAMGWAIREEDSYGRRLESLLNEHGAEEIRYEVVNAGVPGWNLQNALAYLQAKGLQYEPDLVLLDLTTANDIKGGSALVPSDRPAPFDWLRAHTYFWPFLTVQLRWLEARAEGRERIDVIDPPTDPEKYFPLDVGDDQWVEVWNEVLAIDRVAREHQAPIVLILFPLEFQVVDPSYPTLPQEVLTARAAEAGIPVLDLLPAFRQACREKPGGVCHREDRYLFADVWMHPSAYGHQLTAVELQTLVTRILTH